MAKYLIKPNFNRISQQATIPAKKLNVFMRTEMQDTFGAYQRLFGLYSYMRLNKKLKYVIHTLTGNPMMWQSNKSCSWDPTGALRIGKKELEPCEAKMNEEFCDDELMNSCFEHLNQIGVNGRKELDPDGIAIINEALRVIATNATLGARLTLTAGQLYDPSKVKFNSNATDEIKSLFRKTAGTCRGWVELVKEMAAKYAKYKHMNLSGILNPGDFDGKKFNGDVVLDIYDKLLEDASTPEKLCSMVDQGGTVSGDGTIGNQPIFVLSTHLFKCLKQQYRKECRAVCRDPRLTARDVPMGNGTMKVYYIDDTPVVPIDDLNCYDQYLTGCTHLAAITLAGNIGLGASFGALPDTDTPDVGLSIERGTKNEDRGKITVASHSYFLASIADPECYVGTQVYAEPKAA